MIVGEAIGSAGGLPTRLLGYRVPPTPLDAP